MTDTNNNGGNKNDGLSPLQRLRLERQQKAAQEKQQGAPVQVPEPQRSPASAFGSQNMTAPDRQAGEQESGNGGNVLKFPGPAPAPQQQAPEAPVVAPTAPVAAPAATSAETETLKQEVASLRNELAELKTALDALKTATSTPTQNTEVTELRTKVTELETELAGVKTTANEAKTAADGAKTASDGAVAMLDEVGGMVAPAVQFTAEYGQVLSEATDDAIVLEGCNAKDFGETMNAIGPVKARAGLERKAQSFDSETKAKAAAALDSSTELGLAFADAAVLWAAGNTDAEAFKTALGTVIEVLGNGNSDAGVNVTLARLQELAVSPDVAKATIAQKAMSMI